MRRLFGPMILALTVLLTGALVSPASATAAVERAQRRLNALYCNAGPVDGAFGTWTKTAVIRFQSRHALAQTGQLDTATTNRLYAATARRCDIRAVPATGTGRRIVISRKQNWLWLVRADGSVVSQGGMADNSGELAPGTYYTGSYCGRAARIRLNRSTSGSLWLDNFIRFAPCGFGFHRIPRRMSDGKQIHADYILGTNLGTSHGCIRLTKAMSERVWDFTAPSRTKIKIV